MAKRLHHRLSYFASSFMLVVGVVLVWRGVWYVLDWIDKSFFNGGHIVSTILGIVLGVLILYIPDHDLKELRKL